MQLGLVQVNCILVIQWDFKNLMNIHLWRLAILLWDQLVTNQTCHFHRVYSVKVHQLCLLIYTLLGSSRIFCRRTYKYRISYKSFHFRCNSIKDLNFRIHSFTACFKLINNQISLSFKNILTSFSSSISFLLLLYWDGLTNLAKVIIVTPLSVLDPSASAGVDAAWSFLLVMGIIMAS